MPDFSRRSRQTELMDELERVQSDQVAPALRQNLDELERINYWLGGNAVVIDAIERLRKQGAFPADRPLAVCDYGTGGGDLPRSIVRWARKKGVSVEILGVDYNPVMIGYSQEKSTAFPEVRFALRDLFDDSFPAEPFDLVLCSLFCHHFTEEELPKLLGRAFRQARLAVIVNDLHRHPLAYYGIKLITWLARGSYLVQNDAPLSVLRGFARSELEAAFRSTGAKRYDLRWKWAFRFQGILYK